jgi:protein-disulfide isomerase
MNPNQNNINSWLIPIAIIIGFSLLAVALYLSSNRNYSPTTATQPITSNSDARIRPVDETDFIKGNPNAPILIVEYSDYDCPFCKMFHETMNRIMNEYGVTGKVGWVYRQFPLTELHPNSARISRNALCIGQLAGNEAFWRFSDLVFQERNNTEPTNITRLPDYAERLGVKQEDLFRCLQDEATEKRLLRDIEDAVNVGFKSTPHSFVIVGNQIAPIEGAQPYEAIKSIIDSLITQLEGSSSN